MLIADVMSLGVLLVSYVIMWLFVRGKYLFPMAASINFVAVDVFVFLSGCCSPVGEFLCCGSFSLVVNPELEPSYNFRHRFEACDGTALEK